MIPMTTRKKVILTRTTAHADRTLGTIHVYDGPTEVGRFCCLELPDRGNARNISRIPAGKYRLTPEVGGRFRDHFRVHDVPGRDGILGHRGNFPADTRGCLILGLRFADLDADGLFDVSQSDAALRLFSSLVTAEADLFVFDADS
jgi:hypothetical protein